MSAISAEDDRAHQPGPKATNAWQESFAFQFYDPISRVGGYLHAGVQRKLGRADLWSWIALDGRTVHNFQHLDLDAPAQDFPDFRLGPVRILSTTPITGRRISVADDTTTLELDFIAYREPAHYAEALGDNGSFADGHYETLGRARGTLKIGDRTIAVDAYAFDDRSWGERNWTNLYSHRFLWATFSRNLHLVTYVVSTSNGTSTFGYLQDGEDRHDIQRLDIDVSVASNGVYAKGFEAIAWTKDAGGYRFTGKADGNLIVTQQNHFMQSPTLCRVEMNGRVGGGLLELNELKRPTPALIAEYGLMPHPNDLT